MAEVYLGVGRTESLVMPDAMIVAHTPENSTAARLENIVARFARIEARLIENERKAATTLPPLRPEPDPPDGLPLCTAAQPPYPPYQPPLPPYTLTQPDPSSHWYTPQRREQPGYQYYFHNQPTPSNDHYQSLQQSYRQPPLVPAAFPHQNYPQLPPLKPYQPPPLTLPAAATSPLHQNHQSQTPYTHQPPSPYQQPLLNQPSQHSQRNAFTSEDQFVNMPYRMATAWDLPETHIVLEQQAVEQTSCWDHQALRSHQGYHSYEQPTVVQQPVPQCLPYCWNPLSHHCSPTAELPAAVAAPPLADDSRQPLCLHVTSAMRKIMVEEEHWDEPARVPSMNSIFETDAKEVVDRDVATFDIGDVSNPTIGLPSDTHGIGESRDGCHEDQQVSSIEEMFSPGSPVLCGEETSMLDDEEEKGFLVYSRSSRVKGEECSYNEKVDQIELLSAPCFNIVTLNELVTHSPPIGGFSKDDHLDEKELISETNFFGYSDVEGRKMLLIEQDRDDDGQVTLNDLEIAITIKNVRRRPAKKFLKHRSTKKSLKCTRSCHELLSVIAFDPGGKTLWLRLSLSLVVAWSQYLSGEKVVGVIVASPHKEVREGKSMVNLSELFATFANDVICIVALGRNYGEGQDFTKVTEEFDKELDVLLGSFDEGKFVPWLCWIKFVNGISGKIRRVSRKINEFLKFVVREHVGERKEGEKDYVDVWLEVPRNERCGFVLDDISIKALIMDMFATGSDTAITLIEWMLSELIRHKKAKNELFFMVDVFTLHQLCASREHYTFDPGGDNLPKLRLSTFFVASWFPP